MKQVHNIFGWTFFVVARQTLAHRIVVSLFVLAFLFLGVSQFIKVIGADASTPIYMPFVWFINGGVYCLISAAVLWVIWRRQSPPSEGSSSERDSD